MKDDRVQMHFNEVTVLNKGTLSPDSVKDVLEAEGMSTLDKAKALLDGTTMSSTSDTVTRGKMFK